MANLQNLKKNNSRVTNDPLGRPTDPASSDGRLILKNGRTYNLCENIMITTGRDWVGHVDQKT